MKQKFLCVVTICLPLFIFCQNVVTDSGIKWTQGLSWQQVTQKAKKENKYIFVDCYATWCKPCAEMDQNVYTVDSVGDYLNTAFISVKLQMDQTKNDDAATKSWYKTASNFSKEYNLTAYPTLLFFTPTGELAIKEVGFKDPSSFITSASNSKDPSKQYYVLLKNYKKGKLDNAAKRSLISTAKSLNDTANYIALRRDYFAYLHALPKEDLYTKENIEFIASVISRRSHVVFDMFYPDGSTVDKVMEKNGYARKVVERVITNEKVIPVFNAAIDAKQAPDWSIIFNSIAKDYNDEYADRAVMDAKWKWYSSIERNVLKWANSLNDKMEKYGSDTTSRGDDFVLNNQAFLLWLDIGRSAKPNNDEISELTRISKWMEDVVRRGATATGFRLEQWHLYIDTYANLLYKIGKTAEAVKWEEFAILKCKEIGGGWKGELDGYEDRLNKMKNGEPTWPLADEKK